MLYQCPLCGNRLETFLLCERIVPNPFLEDEECQNDGIPLVALDAGAWEEP